MRDDRITKPYKTSMQNHTIVPDQNQLDDQTKLLERKTKEIEIIQQVSSEINKTLDIDLISKAMLLAMD